jgi:sialate O-acetylesterase
VKNIVYSGPIYRKMKVEKDKIRIYFNYTGSGLVSRDGPPTHFEIAGKDRIFFKANAVIDGKTVLVSSDMVKEPVAVRFAWSDIAEPNLFNNEGLPASTFRTDDWPCSTYGLK